MNLDRTFIVYLLALVIISHGVDPHLVFARPLKLIKLRVESEGRGVVGISWKIRGTVLEGETLSLDRRREFGGRFEHVDTILIDGTGLIGGPGSSAIDAVRESGIYRYRGRLGVGKAKGRWVRSNRLVVLAPSSSATPQASPGPTGPQLEDSPVPTPTPKLEDERANDEAVEEEIVVTPTTDPTDCNSVGELIVVELINGLRSESGLGTLSVNDLLKLSSRAHSVQLTKDMRLTHEGWLGYIRKVGYQGKVVGENIAFGYTSSNKLVEAWYASPGHRRNLLNPRFTEVGISCERDANNRTWWVQNFGG